MTFFGPIPWFDLIRLARRKRHFWLRTVYGLMLLGSLYMTYSGAGLTLRGTMHINEMSRFAQNFFVNFMCAQYLAILVLTPAYVGGAIAEEKENRNLEFLLTTQLDDREIVVGKLAARLAHLILVLLTGLPILSLTLLFGGIGPLLLFGAFAWSLGNLLAIGSIAIWCSVQRRRHTEAILESYVAGGAMYAFACGLPAIAMAMPGGGPLGEALLFFAVLQVYVAYVFLTNAVVKFRPMCVRHSEASPDAAAAVERPKVVAKSRQPAKDQAELPKPRAASPRPPVGDRPVLWKEIHVGVEAAVGMRGSDGENALSLRGILIVLAALVLSGLLLRLPNAGQRATVHLLLRLFGAILTFTLFIPIAVRSAACVVLERDKRTLESLLSAPLSLCEILGDKWRGSLLHPRAGLGLLSAVWIIGVVSGSLHWLAFPAAVLALAAYAGFVASLGLALSVRAASSAQAQMWTMALGAFFFLGGPWWLSDAGTRFHLAYNVRDAVGLGMTPAAVLAMIAFTGTEREPSNWTMTRMMGCAGSVLMFAGVAWVLWRYAYEQFQRRYGRVDDQPRSNQMPKQLPKEPSN